MWPQSSSHCCWNCCHQFPNVPALLPTLDNSGRFKLSGNFCSWNCVKSYVHHHGFVKPRGTEFVPIFAFLTVHRPKYCPISPEIKHPVDCPCIERYTPLINAPNRNSLKMFGGNLSITQFRKNFSSIRDYSNITKLFQLDRDGRIHGHRLPTKPYLYCILSSYPEEVVVPMSKTNRKSRGRTSRMIQEEESEDESEPIVYTT